ncbi:MAG: tRNA (guanine(46)-N(7))-methyltransferase TrmB [Roseovarius sp.]
MDGGVHPWPGAAMSDSARPPAGHPAAAGGGSGAPRRNFYGRLKGKHLRPSQQAYLDEDLAKLSLGDVGWDVNPDRKPIDLEAIFGKRQIWLEIGFGGGEHLLHQAARHPDIGFVGCEPYINGVAMLLGKIRRAGCDNIRIHPGDVRDLFDVLPDAAIARAFLLYPDPWPKKRHHRRRFVTPEHLVPLARVMAPGAILRVATDIPDYVRQTLLEVPRQGFEWLAERPADWRVPWPDWLSTRYEAKALRAGRVPHYLTFRRAAG